jgi:RNA polymerase sigma factor (sigma-70 family)
MSFSSTIDEVTFVALRRGCRTAQERVYHTYSGAAWTLAVRLTGCESSSWDVVQNAFIKAFTRIEQLDSRTGFAGWLRQIIARQVIDDFRKQPTQLGEPSESATDAVDHVVNIDVQRALAALDAVDRAVLWLHDVEGLTHSELAALFDESVSWSKSRLSRVRARLREQLGAAEGAQQKELSHG